MIKARTAIILLISLITAPVFSDSLAESLEQFLQIIDQQIREAEAQECPVSIVEYLVALFDGRFDHPQTGYRLAQVTHDIASGSLYFDQRVRGILEYKSKVGDGIPGFTADGFLSVINDVFLMEYRFRGRYSQDMPQLELANKIGKGNLVLGTAIQSTMLLFSSLLSERENENGELAQNLTKLLRNIVDFGDEEVNLSLIKQFSGLAKNNSRIGLSNRLQVRIFLAELAESKTASSSVSSLAGSTLEQIGISPDLRRTIICVAKIAPAAK